MSIRFKQGTIEGTHIYFDPAPQNPVNKTKRWFVVSKHDKDSKDDGVVLADVAWYNGWRKYAMYPRDQTVYEEVCLREIADFCEQQNKGT